VQNAPPNFGISCPRCGIFEFWSVVLRILSFGAVALWEKMAAMFDWQMVKKEGIGVGITCFLALQEIAQ
jgi:hypothetical protein